MAEPGSIDEATLRALEERLERATAAAERLLGEAAEEAGSGSGVPPRGWQRATDKDGDAAGASARPGWVGSEDLELLASVLSGLRELVPADLQQRIVGAVRELLLAVRALLDWALEHMQRRAAQSAEVQDIPIL